MAERGAIDGVSEFFGLPWESFDRVRVTTRPELVNPAGLLSGATTYALVDYCMDSIFPGGPLSV